MEKQSDEVEYIDAYDLDGDGTADSTKVIKTIVGDVASPSIVTFEYYDQLGRLIRDGGMHEGTEYHNTYEYNYAGHKTGEKTARANDEQWPADYTTEFTTDYAGRNKQVNNIEGAIITSEYNAFGQITKITDTYGNISPTPYSSEFTYDKLGRVIEERIPFEDKGSIKYTIQKHYYDNKGNVIREAVTNNLDSTSFAITDYEYDSNDQLIQVKTYNNDQAENYTQYYYDAVGNTMRMYTGLSGPLTINGLDNVVVGSDSKYSVTKYDYDHLGNLLHVTDPQGQMESFTYDDNRIMETMTDREGQLHSYVYDGLGRQKEHKVITDSGTDITSQQYTLTGAILSASTDNSTQSYIYDDLGHIVTETDEGESVVKEYTYFSNNKINTLVIKKENVVISNVKYYYDAIDRLNAVQDENNVLQAVYTYDLNGNRKTMTYPNGVITYYDYNIGNLLETLTNKKGDTVLSQYSYSYYLDGNQHRKTDHLVMSQPIPMMI